MLGEERLHPRLGPLVDREGDVAAGAVAGVLAALVAPELRQHDLAEVGRQVGDEAARSDGRSAVSGSGLGPRPERHVDVHLLAVADDRQRDLVAGVVGRDQPREVVLGHELLTVDGDDRVAADRDLAALELDLRLVAGRALQAGLVGGAAGDDARDQRAGRRVDAELLGELRVERLALDADVGVLDLAVRREAGRPSA